MGDLAANVGVQVPLTTFRYRSLIENYEVPVATTHAIVGDLPYSMSMGIDQFVSWYRAEVVRRRMVNRDTP
jgi:hypothetical protein